MLRLDHVVVPIWHVKKSLAFYRDFLGLKLTDAQEGDEWGGRRWLMLSFTLADQRQIVLAYLRGVRRPAAGPLPKDLRRITLTQTAALDRWRVKLTKAEIAYSETEEGERRVISFEDPNGNMLALTSPQLMAPKPDPEEVMAVLRRWTKDV